MNLLTPHSRQRSCDGPLCAGAVRFVAFALFLATAVASVPGQSSAPVAPSQLNQRSFNCGSPSVAVSTAGAVYAVWDGYDATGRHVWFAQRGPGGQWSPEIRLSGDLMAESFDPAMAVDAAGAPHVVWCGRVGALYRVYYSRLTGGGPAADAASVGAQPPAGVPAWTPPRRLDVTDELNCELPSIAFDLAGRRVVVWQAGLGAFYRIYGAVAAPDGEDWRVDLLGDDAEGDHCFSPQLVGGIDAMAFWYTCDADRCRLRAARCPGGPSDEWRMTPREAFDALPVDRLPRLVPDKEGGVVAMWTDAAGDALERVWMARRLPDGALAEGLADDRPGAINRYPVADVDPQRRVAVCWVAESGGENRVVVRLSEPGIDYPSVAISDPADPFVEDPAVALSGNGWLHAVWRSKRSSGGSGNVFHAALAY